MKNKISVFILGILMISLASAIYSGETANVSFWGQLDVIENWTLTGNTSAINITNNSLEFTYTIPTDYEAGQFTITATGYKNGYPVEVISGGGGGGSSKPVIKPIVNQTNQTVPIITPIENANQTNQTTPVNNTDEKKPNKILGYSLIIFSIAGAIFVVIMLSLYLKKQKNKNIPEN